MTRKDLVRETTSLLREADARKPISSTKHVFHITDDDGNKKDFIVRKKERGAIYTVDDVDIILDACQKVIENALKRGEHVSVRGFGTLGLHYRKERAAKRPGTDEWVTVSARYVPRFEFGNVLRTCAKIYEASKNDRLPEPQCAETDGE